MGRQFAPHMAKRIDMFMFISSRHDNTMGLTHHSCHNRIAQLSRMFIGKDKQTVVRYVTQEFLQCACRISSSYDTLFIHYIMVYAFPHCKDTNKRARNIKLAWIFISASESIFASIAKIRIKRARNIKLAWFYFTEYSKKRLRVFCWPIDKKHLPCGSGKGGIEPAVVVNGRGVRRKIAPVEINASPLSTLSLVAGDGIGIFDL